MCIIKANLCKHLVVLDKSSFLKDCMLKFACHNANLYVWKYWGWVELVQKF